MALLNTDLLTARTQSFRTTRHMLGNAFQEGVLAAGDYKVTPTGVSLQWSVAAGDAWVQGDDTTRQGLYHQVNDAAVTGLVAAGHATLPRIDQVILSIKDSSVTGVSDTPTLSTLAGTATAGATLDNRTGAAALPNSALRLADILVPAALSGTISAGNIRDRRPWARGAYVSIVRNANAAAANDYTTTSTTPVIVDATNLNPRIECSGVPITVSLRGLGTAVTQSATVELRMDGAQVNGGPRFDVAAGGNTGLAFAWDIVPSAGSHTFAPYFFEQAAGTATLFARATIPLELVVREDVRQNASNT